ncbi:phosphodiester glycosidase family protein [Paenactinomyces guangxiensis]|uniref:Phosphodiester glycosidase family protein n=1 Tax=Paenactinomyces guangxiensis TaxID=1490290 RepID=A0A7W1WR68_9BACL|nr:phosphodiester glycosidase family protein [Paenactinomyces guangxiensis]MBA4494575.1 phosphodiester glycosidase family protein [Paenactinomyces guangxiensis]MBH8591662.1 phosphodiester glycosidase family protein [Paenactinomyces guangxiensis]
MNSLKKGLLFWLTLLMILTPGFTWAQEPPIHESGELLSLQKEEGSLKAGVQQTAEVIHEESEEEQIGTGISLTQFKRFDTRGWIEGASLTVSLSEPTVHTDLLTAGKVANSAPLSRQMQDAGAIAGVNGDFFDIGNTQAALGAEVQSGKVRKSGNSLTASVTKDRLGQISQLLLQGTITAGDKSHSFNLLNSPSLGGDQLGVYTAEWGEASRQHLIGTGNDFVEVLLENGKVSQTFESSVYSRPLTESQTLLSGKGKAGLFLKQLQPGLEVKVEIKTNPDYQKLSFAVGGGALLVKEGKVVTSDNGPLHPRTAVGFSKDGKKMILATVDGRSKDSRGMTLLELAHWMKEQGAWTALNLDGGGSSTMIARRQGVEGLQVINTPSDGAERPVPNGVGIWNDKKTGVLKGMKLESYSHRVFSGLSRTFRANAYDTAYAPLKLDPKKIHWKARPASLGYFDGSVLKAKHPGKGKVEAGVLAIKSNTPIHVLGKPVSLFIEPKQIGLEKGKTSRFLVTGKDKNGYRTFIEPRDIQFTYDQQVIELKENEDGSLSVIPKVDKGATLLTARVGDLTVQAGVTVGLEEKVIETFENTTNPWTFSKAPAETVGKLSYVDSPERNGKVIRLDYDFTRSTRTRAVYALPPGGLMVLPGDVKKIGVHVYGDHGNGHWLRTRIKDAAGVYHTLDLAAKVDWKGWKYVEATVPSGVQYPIQLNQIYLVEPDAKRQDTGYILFDDVKIHVTEKLDLPKKQKPVRHPMVLQNRAIPGSMWKYAVFNDMHVVSTNPESKDVKNLVQALQEISDEKVDFVIFNGDLVDMDTPENYAFVKEIIEKHLKVPYYVTPGNHETYGSGNIDNFIKAFGSNAAFHSFVHKGTHFILVNTSLGGLRVSDTEQWFKLKQLLEQSKTDDQVQQLVLLGHHPVQDPNPAKNSQFSDSKEGELLQKWLTQFSEESGKPASMIGAHAHVNHWDQLDGIPYAVIGPVGKQLYGAKDEGGFYSYAVFGVQSGPNRRRPQMVADIRPILSDITLEKETYSVGKEEKVPLTGVQAAGWTFPLDYPATVLYSGSQGLVISETDVNRGQSQRAIALFNPRKQTIQFIRPGRVELTVQSSDFRKTFILEGK